MNSKTLFFLFVFTYLSVITQNSFGQQFSTNEKSVLLPVNQLFEGMLNADSSLVKQTFAKDAELFTVSKKENEPYFQQGSVDAFVKFIGNGKASDYKESISNEKVKIDGDLAMVWCDYTFYLKNELHHCGVNLFLLLKTSNGWKIRQITDTRRQGCD